MRDDLATDRDAVFRWNAGAWFGSCIGGVAWMFPLAWQFYSVGSVASAICVVELFATLLLIAIGLWSLRKRVTAYAALQTILVCMGVASFVIVALAQRAPLPADMRYGLPLALLVIPLLMGFFALQQRSGLRGLNSNEDAA